MDETIRNFLDCDFFYNILLENNIDFFTGVPDSLLKDFCYYITSNTPKNKHIISANEGNSIGIASGYHLATKKIPLVYLQNSGFGNIINPITSLVHHKVYNIPMLILIGWRGEPGKKDEPQHKAMGEIQIKLLKTLGIKFKILPDYNSGAKEELEKAIKYMKETNKPFVFLVKKQTFRKLEIKVKNNESEYHFTREEILSFILKNIKEDSLILSTTGMLSRELYEYRENNNQELRDFLCVGSMGHLSSISLGLSLGIDNNVVTLDGDGSLIMHMGAMCVNGCNGNKNFKHIVINNGAHDSVGGQPTEGFNINLNEIARSCNYKIIECDNFNDENSVCESVNKVMNSEGPIFLELRCKKGNRNNLGRPPSSLENKISFINHINKLNGTD